MRVAHPELVRAILLLDRPVHDLGATGDELLIQALDILDLDVDVEHVGWDGDAVRSRMDAVPVGEMDTAGVSLREPVVLGQGVVAVDLEAELVPVVVDRTSDTSSAGL